MNRYAITLLLLVTHLGVGAGGFALGIYALPILIAPAPPTAEAVRSAAEGAAYTGRFQRDLTDSDALHWGEGEVFVRPDVVAFEGRLAPGPDYRLYLSPAFVETEAAFAELKPEMVHVGPVRTFENFMVPVPAGIDVARYRAVIVWCETFGQFISAASYQ